MSNQLKESLRTISTVLVIVIVILAFLIAGIRIFGFHIYGVTSRSMEPEYPKGSLVYVQRMDVRDLRVRDVITYQLDKKNISTHRIVEIVPDENNANVLRFRTKGDANNEADTRLVTEADIIGKVAFCIPHLGNIASYIQQPPGLYVAIAVGAALVAIAVITDKMTADDAAAQPPKKKKGLLTVLGVNKKKPGKESAPLKQGYVPGQANRTSQPQIMQAGVQPQQYPQGYAQPQQYPQGYAQPQQYPQGYAQPQQYPQGYAQPQQYPQGYAQPQQYPQGYAQPQQYPQGYAQPQQYPQGYAQPQGYMQRQQGKQQQ